MISLCAGLVEITEVDAFAIVRRRICLGGRQYKAIPFGSQPTQCFPLCIFCMPLFVVAHRVWLVGKDVRVINNHHIRYPTFEVLQHLQLSIYVIYIGRVVVKVEPLKPFPNNLFELYTLLVCLTPIQWVNRWGLFVPHRTHVPVGAAPGTVITSHIIGWGILKSFSISQTNIASPMAPCARIILVLTSIHNGHHHGSTIFKVVAASGPPNIHTEVNLFCGHITHTKEGCVVSIA